MLLAIGAYAWYTRHPSAADVLGAKIALPDSEKAALEKLLDAAGVPPHAVRVIEVEPEQPCWSHHYRQTLDHRLGVYRQYGRFGENCIGIDQGQIVGLSLVDTELTDLTPLADLPALRNLQLRNARIETIDGLPDPCPWERVNLAQNALRDIKPLLACADLKELDVSFNRLESLPDLRSLVRLEQLDARKNVLTDVGGIARHPILQRLDLGANRLASTDSLSNMPWLETLFLGSNALTSLEGLHDLPALKSLYADANRLTAVDMQLPSLPVLRHVSLSGNPIAEMPPGFIRQEDRWGATTIMPEDRLMPVINMAQTPLAQRFGMDDRAHHDPAHRYDVASLPRGRGRAQGTTRRGRSGYGPFSSGVHMEGTIDWLDGTHSESFSVDRGLNVTVTASVEKGRLRVYLGTSEGYYYGLAIPGHPLEISGRLITGTSSYFVYFESEGQRVEGIRWTVDG